MSIAIHTHTAHAPARRLAGSHARAVATTRSELSRAEELREARGLMRHFVLAFAAAGAGIYAIVAAGLTF